MDVQFGTRNNQKSWQAFKVSQKRYAQKRETKIVIQFVSENGGNFVHHLKPFAESIVEFNIVGYFEHISMNRVIKVSFQTEIHAKKCPSEQITKG